ncbi:polyprenyl synthetase family protein [Candidatus Micrarchaeota archaeon]|nr:polyprenyl synthetase family protein [Candidatus Micrarchaeota archaeon]
MPADSDIERILEEKRAGIDRTIAKYLPREYGAKEFEFACGKPRYAHLTREATEAISKPMWDLLDRGGKRWRPVLFMLIIEALGGDPKKVEDLIVIPELVHNATLIHDDIEDNSETRRGKPCLHKIYGVDIAINVGDGLYYVPMLSVLRNTRLDDNTRIRILETYMQEMINITFGQGADIYWHKGMRKEVGEEEYLQMCAFKTGTLARMSAKIAAIASGGNAKTIEACGRFAEAIGVAFQIQDDVLTVSNAGRFKKEFGEDITEGKRSLMVIHCFNNAPKKDAGRLRGILDAHTRDPKRIAEAISLLEKTGSVDYAKKRSREIVGGAWGELEPLLKGSPAKEKLRLFAEFLSNREM